MDEDRNEIPRRILSVALEIIYLLTGEDYTLVKASDDPMIPSGRESGGRGRRRSLITDPPPHCRILEKNNKKILDLTNKMIELLTGEVPIRCQDVAVYLSMEEWEYLEGHQDLYEEVMMEEDQPRTSPDGTGSRNPPERCPRPLYSQDHPEENHNILENSQAEDLIDIKVVVIDDEEEAETEAGQLYELIETNSPERCPRPLYPQDRPEENHNVLEKHQDEDLTFIKLEAKEEGKTMRGDLSCMREVEEEIPGNVTAENPTRNAKGNFRLLLNYKVEDEDIVQLSHGEKCTTEQPKLHRTNLSYNLPNHEVPLPDQSQIMGTRTLEKPYSCSKCGKHFTDKSHLVIHERSHTVKKL